jgi:TonB family protein
VKLIVFAVLAALSILFYPLLNEDVENACHALEKRVVGVIAAPLLDGGAEKLLAQALLGAAGELSRGSLAAGFIKRQYPNVPPFAGCATMYWRVLLDPSVVTELARQVGLSELFPEQPEVRATERAREVELSDQRPVPPDEVLQASLLTVGEPVTGSLHADNSAEHFLDLIPRMTYVIDGTCDDDCTDLDLVAQDGAEILASDTEMDAYPRLTFSARRAGRAVVRVHMLSCSIAPCGYTLRMRQLDPRYDVAPGAGEDGFGNAAERAAVERASREDGIATFVRGGAPQVPQGDQPYSELEVQKPAAMQGVADMNYPEMLRSAQVEGTVLASFVVDTTGRADMSTFKVLRSDHELFTNSVRNALPRVRYLPAEVGGRKVKQLVQQPFVFNLAR